MDFDLDLFKKLYLEKEYSTRDLAKYFKISQSTVRRRLQKHGIPTRTWEESRKTKKFKAKLEQQSEKLRIDIEKTCIFCNKKFLTKPHLNAKYCNKECHQAHITEKSFVKTKCTQCGKEYKTKRRNLKYSRKFCSLECLATFKSENFSGKNSHSYKKIKRACGNCQKEIWIPPHRNKMKYVYCDKNCMANHYKARLKGNSNPHWKGGKLRYYGEDWLNQRRLCRERDNYQCQRCGRTEKENLEELSIHHIVPFRSFEFPKEANQLSNLIGLCRECHTFVHSNNNINKEFIQIKI